MEEQKKGKQTSRETEYVKIWGCGAQRIIRCLQEITTTYIKSNKIAENPHTLQELSFFFWNKVLYFGYNLGFISYTGTAREDRYEFSIIIEKFTIQQTQKQLLGQVL